MEAEAFLRGRRVTAETSDGDYDCDDPGVAGAEVRRWLLGGRFRCQGVSGGMTAASAVTPRVGGELTLQTVHYCCGGGGPQDHPTDDPEADYEGLPRGASTSTHMLAGAVAGIMEHCLMFPIDCVKVAAETPQVPPSPRFNHACV